MITKKVAIRGGLLFALFVTPILCIQMSLFSSILFALFLGTVFAVSMYHFAHSDELLQQTQLSDFEHPDIIRQIGANHFKNGEAVGGKLFLLPRKVFFKSHDLNLQNHDLTIPIQNIQKIKFCRTLGLISNGLIIVTKDGKKEQFVLSQREKWKKEIERLKKHL